MKKTDRDMSRRSALTTLAAASGAALLAQPGHTETASTTTPGRIPQGVSRWCYGKMSLEDLTREAAAIGLVGLDLLSENEWATVNELGLSCTMANGPGNIMIGWNRPEHHEKLVKASEDLLPKAAAAGIKNMVVFSGNRRGLPDDEGITECARGLEKIMPLAESLDITLCMELLNSKRDHRDYQCDHTAWGVDLAKQLGSKHFKLLYDIYHMQIMEGDVIATIQESIEYIAHFHTGGVPGRNEIDETQELYYRRICEAIADTGFKGVLSHEFVPKGDPLTSLRQAFEICTV